MFLGSLVYGDGLYFPLSDTYVTIEFLKKVIHKFASRKIVVKQIGLSFKALMLNSFSLFRLM